MALDLAWPISYELDAAFVPVLDALSDTQDIEFATRPYVNRLALDPLQIDVHGTIQSPAAVLNVEPVPGVGPRPVNGQRLAAERSRNEAGDHLLQVLFGAVVVERPKDHRGDVVSHPVGVH